MVVSVTAIRYGEGNTHFQLEAYLSILKPPREASELCMPGKNGGAGL